jgi:hypothetical protein
MPRERDRRSQHCPALPSHGNRWAASLSLALCIASLAAGFPHAQTPAPATAFSPPASSPPSAAPTSQVATSPAIPAPRVTNADSPPYHHRDALLIRIFCAMSGIMAIYPILRFLFSQWSFRQQRIFGNLAGDAVVFYYQQFRPGSAVIPQSNVRPIFPEATSRAYMDAFSTDFYRWYGRKYYIAPVLMLTFVTVALAVWAEKMLRFWASASRNPEGLRALTAAALAGALVWVISDTLDRLRRRDFTTVDVYYYTFRILLAIPFAWALSVVYIGDKEIGLSMAIPLAFFLGAFPTQTLFTIARRIGSQQLKLGDDQVTGSLELEKLQAIGKTTAERFKDEGIATINGLAYADPIDLTIRTNFDFNYVVSCVSQALMYIYFGEDGKKLARFSMIGALEIAAILRWTRDDEKRALTEKTIQDAAAALNLSPEALRINLAQIAEDPYTTFLANVWT